MILNTQTKLVFFRDYLVQGYYNSDFEEYFFSINASPCSSFQSDPVAAQMAFFISCPICKCL